MSWISETVFTPLTHKEIVKDHSDCELELPFALWNVHEPLKSKNGRWRLELGMFEFQGVKECTRDSWYGFGYLGESLLGLSWKQFLGWVIEVARLTLNVDPAIPLAGVWIWEKKWAEHHDPSLCFLTADTAVSCSRWHAAPPIMDCTPNCEPKWIIHSLRHFCQEFHHINEKTNKIRLSF